MVSTMQSPVQCSAAMAAAVASGDGLLVFGSRFGVMNIITPLGGWYVWRSYIMAWHGAWWFFVRGE